MIGNSITNLGRYLFPMGETVYKAPVQSRPFHYKLKTNILYLKSNLLNKMHGLPT